MPHRIVLPAALSLVLTASASAQSSVDLKSQLTQFYARIAQAEASLQSTTVD